MAYKSNRVAVTRKLRKTVDERLDKSGLIISNAAKTVTPVDSGRLRASISHIKEGNTVYIGTNVYYGPYVELGTRRASAQPYLRPGINNSRGALVALWKTPVDK